jgi:hypothetical protein
MTDTSYIGYLLTKHRSNGAVIDSNLLVLVVIGAYDIERVGRGRTEKYTPNDYRLMLRVINSIERVIVTPNIITEVDNLARQTAIDKVRLAAAIRNLWEKISEVYLPSDPAISSHEYEKSGITDTHILSMASEYKLIITDDLPLYHRLETLRRDAVNINHIREFA